MLWGHSQCPVARVMSKGLDDLAVLGGEGAAEFHLDGARLPFETSRGFNIVTIDPFTGTKHYDIFDTSVGGTDQDAMVAYIKSLSVGTIVLIAVNDDGQGRWNNEIKEALYWCGGGYGAEHLGFRHGYALIGHAGAHYGNGIETYGPKEE